MHTVRRHRVGLRRFVIGSVVGMLVAFTATVVLCIVYFDEIVRYRLMSRICSDDPTAQERGVSYLIMHADDPAVLDRAEAMLETADDACFDRLVHGLSQAGAWGPRFEKAWVRYLVDRVGEKDPQKRTHLAVELGKLLWRRGPEHDDPRLVEVVRKLVADGDPMVRLNAMSAAASLTGPTRVQLIRKLAGDETPAIAKHAWIMLHLLNADEGLTPPESVPAAYLGERPTAPPDDAQPVVKMLAALEAMPIASAESIELMADTPDLIRVAIVRASKAAEPADLEPALNAESPEMRALACVVALERFTGEQCRELAKELILRFTNEARMSGAMLGGMVPDDAADEKLIELLTMRATRGDDWVVMQHYRLALSMRGTPLEGFDPRVVMAHRSLPKLSMVTMLMHMGDLGGLDWLLNPFAEPPADLRLVLDTMRYGHVIRRYLPDAPELWYWADPATQRFQTEVLRDWYLLNRPALRFDARTRRFTTGSHREPRG